MKLRTGYIAKPHEPHHRTFGGVNEIGGAVLNPSGLWGSWLPPQTEQQDIGVEPEDCTSEGTLAAVEILARMQYGDMTVWSKRFLAYASGTTQNGNDPMAVANTLQSKGTVPETDWSNTADLKTWRTAITMTGSVVIPILLTAFGWLLLNAVDKPAQIKSAVQAGVDAAFAQQHTQTK